MGIVHIEDQNIEDFLYTTKNLQSHIVSEKVDGYNLRFGFDMQHKLYVSREGKCGERYYSPSQWPNKSSSNAFRNAHSALVQVEPILSPSFEPGEEVEVEVLFGRQPNAIVYGESYIVFLKMVEGDNKQPANQEKIKLLNWLLNHVTVSTTKPIIKADKLQLLCVVDFETKWNFVAVPELHYVFESVDISDDIKNIEDFLEQPFKGISHRELLGINLNKIPKHSRESVKVSREQASQHIKMLQMNIKEKLLEPLRNRKSVLCSVELSEAEDVGIEGVVLTDPKTNRCVKIVDKEEFTTINYFNHAVRNEIKMTGLSKKTFPQATLSKDEEGVDFYGDVFRSMAIVLGISELGKYRDITKHIRKFIGSDEEQTVDNLAKLVTGPCLNTYFNVLNNLNIAVAHLINLHNQYMDDYGQFTHVTQSGRQLQYSSSVHERTLLTFAELYDELTSIIFSIQKANTNNDIIRILYGRQIGNAHK